MMQEVRKIGWVSSLFISALLTVFVIPKTDSILTGMENIQKKLPPFGFYKDMNNNKCDAQTCARSCDGYCMKEHPCEMSSELNRSPVNYPDESEDETALKTNASSITLEREPSEPYFCHTECLCARSAKRVRYSACYTHNNPPTETSEGGDYSQVTAFEECEQHCSMRVDGYSSKSDVNAKEGSPFENPKIYGALCDTNMTGRVQRFCYCVSFAFQPLAQPGEGWGEDGGWTPHSEDTHGWNSPPHENGWNAPPNGWPSAIPPSGNGWNSPSVPPASNGWSNSIPPSGNGWNSPSVPPASNGWPSAIPPSGNGWSSAIPPSGNGWNPPSSGEAHPPSSAPAGWTTPHQPGNGWNSPPSSHPPSIPAGGKPPTSGEAHSPPPAPPGWNAPSPSQTSNNHHSNNGKPSKVPGKTVHQIKPTAARPLSEKIIPTPKL